MKLDNNLFISNGVNITQHNNYINATILDSWNTPGIKYNKNITLHANTEYIIYIGGDFTNIDNDCNIYIKTADTRKIIYWRNYKTLMYEYRSVNFGKKLFYY